MNPYDNVILVLFGRPVHVQVPNVFRVIHHLDIVPHLPLMAMDYEHHVGEVSFINSVKLEKSEKIEHNIHMYRALLYKCCDCRSGTIMTCRQPHTKCAVETRTSEQLLHLIKRKYKTMTISSSAIYIFFSKCSDGAPDIIFEDHMHYFNMQIKDFVANGCIYE